jgi:hypothetical protein
MSHACCGESEGATRSAAPFRAADGLALAASPTFIVMALLTAVGGGPADLLCAAAPLSPLNGMATMYLLMGAFHAGPWLQLIRARFSVGRG